MLTIVSKKTWRTCDLPVWERVKHIVPVYNAHTSYQIKNLGKILCINTTLNTVVLNKNWKIVWSAHILLLLAGEPVLIKRTGLYMYSNDRYIVFWVNYRIWIIWSIGPILYTMSAWLCIGTLKCIIAMTS